MVLDDSQTTKVGATIIIATFTKDTLTKTAPGKTSHLEKIKKCELVNPSIFYLSTAAN